eukprot:5265545-Pyramimonas_sp.AAC.1
MLKAGPRSGGLAPAKQVSKTKHGIRHNFFNVRADLFGSGVDRPPALTRRLANWSFSARKRASRPSFLRVQ